MLLVQLTAMDVTVQNCQFQHVEGEGFTGRGDQQVVHSGIIPQAE